MKGFFRSTAGKIVTVFLFLLLSAIPVVLLFSEDNKPPVFSGTDDIVTEKYAVLDYEKGVKAKDNRDGKVTFTYDASRVDITSAGVYYVIYTASDRQGNTATYRRRIEVTQNAADTDALVQSIAAGLDDSAEDIRDYVRSSIGYSSDWGGDDPVWYGLQTKTGNCYVHATVLDALLRAKGHTTRLIWCEDKTHYWNLIYLDGQWRHIDSTPSDHTHNKYSLMSDQQRYETLSGRDWDRTAWPACP